MMISKITGREFDETKYANLPVVESVRAQIEDGVMTVEETTERMRQLEAEMLAIDYALAVNGSIGITPMMVAGHALINAMRTVLAEHGVDRDEVTLTPVDHTTIGIAVRMLEKMTPTEYAAWEQRQQEMEDRQYRADHFDDDDGGNWM